MPSGQWGLGTWRMAVRGPALCVSPTNVCTDDVLPERAREHARELRIAQWRAGGALACHRAERSDETTQRGVERAEVLNV